MRSFIAGDALAEVMANDYPFDHPVECKMFSKMLRSQDNDHYKAVVGDNRYVVRIYQEGTHLNRTESDYQFELEWLNFLHENDLPVSYPIQRKDGGFLGKVLAPEGIRYYAVFSFADGAPMDKTNMDQLYDCGVYMAQIHEISKDFTSDHTRAKADLGLLVDHSVTRIRRAWTDDRAKALDLLLLSAEEAKSEIQNLLGDNRSSDVWGVIGGDFHNANTHVTKDGRMTFFNFDLCAYSWWAYDIAVFLSNTQLIQSSLTTTERTEAFLAGYYSVRPLSENEHASIAPFLTIRRIWMMGAFARVNGLVGHTFLAPA
jgi:Ser/Thr protein kinase RdoA (MazF antagonist)